MISGGLARFEGSCLSAMSTVQTLMQESNCSSQLEVYTLCMGVASSGADLEKTDTTAFVPASQEEQAASLVDHMLLRGLFACLNESCIKTRREKFGNIAKSCKI